MFALIVILLCVALTNARSPVIPGPIDLSHALDESTLTWDPNTKFNITEKQIIDKKPNFYAAFSFAGPEHCGTHLDAPYHFNKDGWKVDEIPIERLIAPGVFLDISDRVKDNANFVLMPEHLVEWEEKHGHIRDGSILLVNFGWSERYGDRIAYFGNTTAPYSFPGISPTAAKWIANHGGIYGVGLDTPSTDPGKATVFSTHETLSQSGVYGIENLSFKGVSLPPLGFNVIALPMKIKGGTGGPCRVVVTA